MSIKLNKSSAYSPASSSLAPPSVSWSDSSVLPLPLSVAGSTSLLMT